MQDGRALQRKDNSASPSSKQALLGTQLRAQPRVQAGQTTVCVRQTENAPYIERAGLNVTQPLQSAQRPPQHEMQEERAPQCTRQSTGGPRFGVEKSRWNPPPPPKKRPKTPRIRSGYMTFAIEFYDSPTGKKIRHSGGQAAKEMASRWVSLTDAERVAYTQKGIGNSAPQKQALIEQSAQQAPRHEIKDEGALQRKCTSVPTPTQEARSIVQQVAQHKVQDGRALQRKDNSASPPTKQALLGTQLRAG
jgi:hypothetical protein